MSTTEKERWGEHHHVNTLGDVYTCEGARHDRSNFHENTSFLHLFGSIRGAVSVLSLEMIEIQGYDLVDADEVEPLVAHLFLNRNCSGISGSAF